jgi:hypothetical protein
MSMFNPPRLLCMLALLACGASRAGGVVIYRCTDAFGALTVQNDVPCPKGSHQKKEVIDAPAPMPAYRPAIAPTPIDAPSDKLPATPPVADDNADANKTVADADRLPPPPLYRCNTYDNDSYLSEDAAPAPRCVRLQTTDLAGNADTSAGVACQMVTDQCQRVPDGAACAAWAERLREAQSASTFAAAASVDAAKAELERVRRIATESTCGR